MKDIIVDESYPGLVDGGWCWKLAGSLVAEGSITVTLKKWLIVGEGIEAGWGIKAGSGIEAGEGIKAGWGIEAGLGIKAGSGIEAGLSIVCKKDLSFKFNLFAGTATWKKTTPEECEVRAARIEGEVKHGIVKLLSAPQEKL